MDKLDKSVISLQYVPPKRSHRGVPDAGKLLKDLLDLSLSEPADEVRDSDLAALVGYSTTQIRRIWSVIAGEPIAAFVKRIRLERAAGQLLELEPNIAAVARLAGYASSAALSKAFRCQFECSPSEFRNLNLTEPCRFPGFVLSRDRSAELATCVRINVSDNAAISFLYDGAILAAKMSPDGYVDWCPRRANRKVV